VKSLINLGDNKLVSDVYSEEKIFEVSEYKKLDNLLNQFISRKSHLAYVVDTQDKSVGVVPMEDLIEEILKMEIVDETDTHHDMREQSKIVEQRI